MQITVDRKSTIQYVQKEYDEYKKEYLEGIQAYVKKLREYSKYIEEIAKNGSTEMLKYPPTLPSNQEQQFEDTLEFLNAHTKSELVMDDDEYKDLKQAIKMSKFSNSSHTTSLNSLTY